MLQPQNGFCRLALGTCSTLLCPAFPATALVPEPQLQAPDALQKAVRASSSGRRLSASLCTVYLCKCSGDNFREWCICKACGGGKPAWALLHGSSKEEFAGKGRTFPRCLQRFVVHFFMSFLSNLRGLKLTLFSACAQGKKYSLQSSSQMLTNSGLTFDQNLLRVEAGSLQCS